MFYIENDAYTMLIQAQCLRHFIVEIYDLKWGRAPENCPILPELFQKRNIRIP